MSIRTSIASLIVFVISAGLFAPSCRAAGLLPLERQLREHFPSVALNSQATLDPAQEFVDGRMVSGIRARNGLRVFYPASYNEAFVAEVGEQRVVLRALGAHFAQATISAGKIFMPVLTIRST